MGFYGRYLCVIHLCLCAQYSAIIVRTTTLYSWILQNVNRRASAYRHRPSRSLLPSTPWDDIMWWSWSSSVSPLVSSTGATGPIICLKLSASDRHLWWWHLTEWRTWWGRLERSDPLWCVTDLCGKCRDGRGRRCRQPCCTLWCSFESCLRRGMRCLCWPCWWQHDHRHIFPDLVWTMTKMVAAHPKSQNVPVESKAPEVFNREWMASIVMMGEYVRLMGISNSSSSANGKWCSSSDSIAVFIFLVCVRN